jgi:hypothetical protein
MERTSATEMHATMLPTELVQGNIDIRSPWSEFVSPSDDTRYIKVVEDKDLNMNIDETRLQPGYLQSVCVPVCPVSAIFALDDLPEKWKEYTELNESFVKAGKFAPEEFAKHQGK